MFIMMFLSFLELLKHAIKHNYVSVYNTPKQTIYSLSFFIDEEKYKIELLSEYSHSSNNNIYVKYTLLINDYLVISAFRNVMGTKEEPAQEAIILENLARLCSFKIIKQEKAAQITHMLKNLSFNEYSN